MDAGKTENLGTRLNSEFVLNGLQTLNGKRKAWFGLGNSLPAREPGHSCPNSCFEHKWLLFRIGSPKNKK